MADRSVPDLITLPHHVEFLSDRWLEEAGATFARRSRRGRGRYAGLDFTVSERFTDTPPHLKLPGDVACWSLRIDGEAVTISREFDAEADVTVEGDYQAALYLAQFVGVAAPGGEAEMWREARHLSGDNAFHGAAAVADERAGRLLGLFHDHMARRTVENPDLEHRARRLGLAARIREMDEQGFTVIERAISDDFADEVRKAVVRSVVPEQGASMFWMLYQGRPLERLALNPLALTLIDASLGRGRSWPAWRRSSAVRARARSMSIPTTSTSPSPIPSTP